ATRTRTAQAIRATSRSCWATPRARRTYVGGDHAIESSPGGGDRCRDRGRVELWGRGRRGRRGDGGERRGAVRDLLWEPGGCVPGGLCRLRGRRGVPELVCGGGGWVEGVSEVQCGGGEL